MHWTKKMKFLIVFMISKNQTDLSLLVHQCNLPEWSLVNRIRINIHVTNIWIMYLFHYPTAIIIRKAYVILRNTVKVTNLLNSCWQLINLLLLYISHVTHFPKITRSMIIQQKRELEHGSGIN